jgi:hypothetical protein
MGLITNCKTFEQENGESMIQHVSILKQKISVRFLFHLVIIDRLNDDVSMCTLEQKYEK